MTKISVQQQNSNPWPVFVLTLEGDGARNSVLLNSLTKNAIDHQIVIGVDGRKGLPKHCESLIDRPGAKERYRRSIGDAEFACALSHRSIYDRILSDGLGGAIILEDDAIPTETFFEFVRQKLYQPFDLIMLDHSHARVIGPRIDLAKKIAARTLSLPSCLTTAYSLSSKAAEYLLDAATPLSDVADWPGDITELNALACDPTIVKHTDPEQGSSHLRATRNKARPDPLRFIYRSYWRTWAKKRMSERIS